MDSLAFLERGERAKISPLMVVHGDEGFLKREALVLIRRLVLGSAPEEGALSTHAGDKATFAGVIDDLETMPFFSDRRLVVVDNADPFVTKFRGLLEKKVGHFPAKSVLVLDVKTWAANTRLAKMVPDEAAISCKAAAAHHLAGWCGQWAKTRHGKQLSQPAARLLVDLVGTEMGLLDQELQKLSLYVGKRGKIEAEDVDKLVGHSRVESTFKIFDAVGAGQTGQALALVGRLFDQGEEPLRILGAFTWQLRRLAQAGRLAQQGVPLSRALEQAGVPPFGLRAAEQQLRHLGRARANRLYDWLLEADFGMKGGSPLSPRTILERLVMRLGRKQ